MKKDHKGNPICQGSKAVPNDTKDTPEDDEDVDHNVKFNELDFYVVNRFDPAILNEAQRLKNLNTDTSQSILTMGLTMKKVFLITTSMENKTGDLHGLLAQL